MYKETIKECLDMSVYAIVKAVNGLERMQDTNPAKKEAIQERINVLCHAMTLLTNEKAISGSL